MLFLSSKRGRRWTQGTIGRFVCSNIQRLKIFSVLLLITIVLSLVLQVLKTSDSESGDGFTYGLERGDNNFVREQDIPSELLHYFQKGQLSERLKGPRWKEVLMTLKSRIRSETVSIQESAVRSEQDTKTCQPKNNIFFLKTHKTASSSIMNILFRYGEFHNLTIAFPSHSARFFYPSVFRASYVNGFSAKRKQIFHIMCHHMRFKFTEVEKVMPEDTFYFTILRNPISQMESSFSYFKLHESFQKAKNLEDFLNNSKIFYTNTNKLTNLAKNSMTFDLGFELNGSPEESVLAWHAMDNIFDLVLITEYYDESLILLKDALCWSFYDVLSFPLNSRSNSTKKTLTLETQEKIKSWNHLDWEMYVYFNNSFWKRVQTFGVERMEREVKELQKIRTLMSKKCLEDEVDPAKLRDKSMMPYQSGVAKILGYNLKIGLSGDDELLCQRLITPELQYNTILQNKQKNKLIPAQISGMPMENVTKSALKT
ncbi:galactose-3-O-sulfotransferase 2-like isoform X1 [Phyllobates terribilis]|uniref:galactose-3-O-sulfotransferase 2-like isoform X1 n=1 Tax=Phyllobates terribilis TaxID=111132 RepID=UPI003CCA84D7